MGASLTISIDTHLQGVSGYCALLAGRLEDRRAGAKRTKIATTRRLFTSLQQALPAE